MLAVGIGVFIGFDSNVDVVAAIDSDSDLGKRPPELDPQFVLAPLAVESLGQAGDLDLYAFLHEVVSVIADALQDPVGDVVFGELLLEASDLQEVFVTGDDIGKRGRNDRRSF
jgi:hypothetical protein